MCKNACVPPLSIWTPASLYANARDRDTCSQMQTNCPPSPPPPPPHPPLINCSSRTQTAPPSEIITPPLSPSSPSSTHERHPHQPHSLDPATPSLTLCARHPKIHPPFLPSPPLASPPRPLSFSSPPPADGPRGFSRDRHFAAHRRANCTARQLPPASLDGRMQIGTPLCCRGRLASYESTPPPHH